MNDHPHGKMCKMVQSITAVVYCVNLSPDARSPVSLTRRLRRKVSVTESSAQFLRIQRERLNTMGCGDLRGTRTSCFNALYAARIAAGRSQQERNQFGVCCAASGVGVRLDDATVDHGAHGFMMVVIGHAVSFSLRARQEILAPA